MAKLPKNEQSTEEPTNEQRERTTTEKLRDVVRNFNAAQSALDTAKDAKDAMFSDVAKNLIDNHKSASVVIDGVKYTPRKSSTHKGEDGVHQAPKYPFTLALKNDKAVVDLG